MDAANAISAAGARHVLVTGASTGIGREVAVYLAARGFDVHAGVRRAGDAPAGAKIREVILDVTDAGSIASAAARIESDAGPAGLAGLVNNAGIGVVGPVEMVSMSQWRLQFDVNVLGLVAVTQAVLPALRRRVESAGKGTARIVNISSIAGRVTSPCFGPYSGSKFAVEAISDALRQELRPQGIGVHVIEPGPIKSEIWGKGKRELDSREDAATGRYADVVGRVAKMADDAVRTALPADRVAQIVLTCLTAVSPRARYLVGNGTAMAALAKRLLPDAWMDALLRRVLG